MQGRKDQVSGFGSGQRQLDRIQVSHFADENDVGVFAECGAEGVGERQRVDAQFPLVDQAFLDL